DALVTVWTKQPGDSKSAAIAIWAAPILGGQPRPYLSGIAEADWSSDGSRLASHTPGPGDPMSASNSDQTEGRQIFVAPLGFHSHFLLWSQDRAFIYFVQGSLTPKGELDPADIWRVKPTGGTPERITHHDSRVSHPV